jgi:hypothetical protein
MKSTTTGNLSSPSSLDDTRSGLEALLGFLAADRRNFAEAAAAIAARGAAAVTPRQRAAELVAGIRGALGGDVGGTDWKVSVAGYVFAHEDFLLRSRGIAMNIAPVLAEFGPEETDEVVMRLDAPLTDAIANAASGVRFVSICDANSDQYRWGAIAARDADAVDELIHALGLDGSVGLTVHRPKAARTRATPTEPRPLHRRKRALGAPRTRLPAPQDAAYWAQAVAKVSENLEIRCGYSATRSVEQRFCALLARYSRGDDLAEIAAEGRKLVGHDLPELVARFPPPLSENDPEGFGTPGHASMVRLAALLVLSRASVAEAQAFADAFFSAPRSAGSENAYDQWNAPSLLVDAFLGHLGAKVERPATAVAWPGAFAPLWRCLAPAGPTGDRSANIEYFLAFWHRKMRNEYIEPAFGAVDNYSFIGHWSLEAAATVVIAKIDDSAFRDHPHFPSDFADAAR